MARSAGKSRKSTKKGDGLTPAMRQYAEQKASVPDALLLFRMGDFYELFYDDAVTASRVLGITLTSRNKEPPIPLAGIPYHALEGYLTKLVRSGHKVAISEQVEDPKEAKGVVKREIVRIVTPGTLTDDALLEQNADNYLAALFHRKDEFGLAFVELSTGAFYVQPVSKSTALDELVRLRPAELLVPDMGIDAQGPLAAILDELSGARQAIPGLLVTKRPPHVFDPYQAEQTLLTHFGVATLAGFGFESMNTALCCAAGIIDYLKETQKTSLHHIVKLSQRNTTDYVWIDQATWRSLEIERTLRSGSTSGSLLQSVTRTSSAMGARCLRRWLIAPLRDPARIRERQEAVGDLLDDLPRLEELCDALGQMADIERITSRLGVGRVSPRDLVALGQTLQHVETVAEILERLGEGTRIHEREPAKFLSSRAKQLVGLHDLAVYLSESLDPEAPNVLIDGGVIASGVSEELDRLRSVGSDGQQWLVDFQSREIERSGIPSLKVGFNNVFGYYIEITNAHSSRVPPDYVRKQTLKNAERYITDELKKYETEVLTARDRAISLEQKLFDEIRARATEQIGPLLDLARAVAEIDVAAGLARLADERRYVRPELVDGRVLEIVDGRHPVLEQSLAEKFVPNDCLLGLPPQPGEGDKPASTDPEMLVVLTGPNMAGKSTYIRQVALLTLLAQTGSYVPARSMRFAPADRIFARVGASDEITRGQSTFMVEMTEAANILNNATANSLVIIDELGRGTSTFDGLSLAWAIAETLVKRIGCRTFFATHYHELTRLETYLKGVANYNVSVREWQDGIVFLHRIVRGGTDKSYGVHVAKLAGIGRDTIERSLELLAELEGNLAAEHAQQKRAKKRDRRDDQMMLFADPADEIMKELTALDPDQLTPIDALKHITEWRKKLQ